MTKIKFIEKKGNKLIKSHFLIQNKINKTKNNNNTKIKKLIKIRNDIENMFKKVQAEYFKEIKKQNMTITNLIPYKNHLKTLVIIDENGNVLNDFLRLKKMYVTEKGNLYGIGEDCIFKYDEFKKCYIYNWFHIVKEFKNVSFYGINK